MNPQIRLARVEDAEAIARVHIESWRSTYKDIFPDDFLQRLSIEKRKQQWLNTLTEPQNGTFIYVAELENQMVVGFSCGGRERSGHPVYTGELYAIYLYKNYQGCGIGRQLLNQTAKHLQKNLHQSMLIWVAQQNPAQGFYEAMGGVATSTKQAVIGETLINEISYGWENLSLSFP